MRLGVSPAAASTPTGVFNQRFEALFPRTGALGCVVYFAPPPFFPVYLCTNVGPRGLLAVALPALIVPHSASLWVHRGKASPVCPAVPLLPVWMNVLFYLLGCQTSIQFDFLSVLVVFCF